MLQGERPFKNAMATFSTSANSDLTFAVVFLRMKAEIL